MSTLHSRSVCVALEVNALVSTLETVQNVFLHELVLGNRVKLPSSKSEFFFSWYYNDTKWVLVWLSIRSGYFYTAKWISILSWVLSCIYLRFLNGCYEQVSGYSISWRRCQAIAIHFISIDTQVIYTSFAHPYTVLPRSFSFLVLSLYQHLV